MPKRVVVIFIPEILFAGKIDLVLICMVMDPDKDSG